MIRDPSDGSVKPTTKSAPPNPSSLPSGENGPPVMATLGGADAPSSANNWGLKSLSHPERKPKPAPTKEELAEYYSTHTLGGKLKEQE